MSIYGDPATVGGSNAPVVISDSIDQLKIKILNGMSSNYYEDMRGNTNLRSLHMDNGLMFHVSGSFSNTSSFSIGWNIPKAQCENLQGKYLNFKYAGTTPSNMTNLRGIIQASVSPWANQATTTPTTRKCLISSFPTVSYNSSFVGFMGSAQAGDTIDVYLELVITDD